MKFWICLFVGLLSGAILQGRASIRHARASKLQEAARSTRIGGLIAAACTIVLTMLLFGWPFQDQSKSSYEEVTKTVVEAVTEPYWYFWTTTTNIEKQVTEYVPVVSVERHFNPALLIPMLLIGAISYWAETQVIKYCWRIFG